MRYHLPICTLVALVSMAISYVGLCQILVKIFLQYVRNTAP